MDCFRTCKFISREFWCYFIYLFIYLFIYQLVFISCKAEQPLLGMVLKEKKKRMKSIQERTPPSPISPTLLCLTGKHSVRQRIFESSRARKETVDTEKSCNLLE